jgi:hypothetical protein
MTNTPIKATNKVAAAAAMWDVATDCQYFRHNTGTTLTKREATNAVSDTTPHRGGKRLTCGIFTSVFVHAFVFVRKALTTK